MSSSDKDYKRSLKNFVLNPKMQFRISLYFMVFGLAVLGLMLAAIFSQIENVHVLISNISGLPITQQLEIRHALFGVVKISMIFFLLILVASSIYGVIVSHRIAGPMFAILGYIEELKKGNYQAQRQLRPYDELIPIMDSLNELAKTLKK